jgi:hypothetical protein
MNMHKILLTAIGIFSVIPSILSQGIIDFKDHRILYRGYSNHIQVGTLDGDSDLSISCEGCEVKKDSLDWAIIPQTKSKMLDLVVLNKNKDTVLVEKFLVFPLPIPELYLGEIGNGERIYSKKSKRLIVKYPSGLGFQKLFSVESWTVTVEGCPTMVSGNGNMLSDEALKIIGFAPSGSILKIEVNFKIDDSAENSTRRTSSFFKL